MFPTQAKSYSYTNIWLQFWKGVGSFNMFFIGDYTFFWTKIIIKSKRFLILCILLVKCNSNGEKKRKGDNLSVSKAEWKNSTLFLNHSVAMQTSLPYHPKKSLRRLRSSWFWFFGELKQARGTARAHFAKFNGGRKWECWLYVNRGIEQYIF